MACCISMPNAAPWPLRGVAMPIAIPVASIIGAEMQRMYHGEVVNGYLLCRGNTRMGHIYDKHIR